VRQASRNPKTHVSKANKTFPNQKQMFPNKNKCFQIQNKCSEIKKMVFRTLKNKNHIPQVKTQYTRNQKPYTTTKRK
jgi:hypothetical protein